MTFRLLKTGHKISRCRRFEMHCLSGDRMHQIQTMRMQCLSFNGKMIFFESIQRVIDHGMVDIRHMYADLMGPARFQPAFYPRIVPEALQYPEMGHRFPAAFNDYGHFNAVFRMPSDRRVDGSPFFHDIAMHECPVRPVSRMGLDLFRQAPVCFVRLGRHHDTGRVLIQPVYDARPYDAVYAG